MNGDFSSKITQLLKEHKTLTTQEIYSFFPEQNHKTVSWHLHQQLVRGNIVQAAHGSYVLPPEKYNVDDSVRVLPELSIRAYEALADANYRFYLSGLDALNGLGFSVNGNYPVIVCVEKNRVKDIQLELMRLFDFAATEDDKEMLVNPEFKDRIQFLVFSSDAFELSNEHFALPEKAFVDLYYAVTRMNYPVPVKELPHILSLIKPNHYRFRMATKDRHLSDELNFLMNFNRQFLKELADYL